MSKMKYAPAVDQACDEDHPYSYQQSGEVDALSYPPSPLHAHCMLACKF